MLSAALGRSTMFARVFAPYTFWSENPVSVSQDADFDKEKLKFDSLVVVSHDITKVSIAESSYLKKFIQALEFQKQNDSAFEEVQTFLSVKIAKYEGIQKLVYSPVGCLTRHYDDVRRFADAANKGIKRALQSGAKRPILAVLYEEKNNDKYQSYNLASILGAAEALYVPVEVREGVPEKVAKVEAFGYTTLGSMDKISSQIELGRIAYRDIGGSDPERMAAPNVAKYVSDIFTDTKVKVSIVEDSATIEKEYPLLAAVNRCAKGVQRHAARVIFLTYEPEGTYDKTLVLVGKGVTYDTGGADLKVNGHMAGMHRDKCGSAFVAGFLRTVAALKPKGIKVMGAMAMVRNSIGSDCYVSDEIVTSRAGKRIRIGNTDAEGRMAMADVLCHMKEKVLQDKEPNPSLFTIATLTGHACLAVGEYTIIVDNGAAAAANVGKSIQKAGYLFGDMIELSTLRREDYEFHKGKSEYEDLLQCNDKPSSQTARGHQTPAAFLIQASGLDKHDVDSDKPLKYCHVDIAGSSGPFPGIPSGAPIPAFTANYLL